MFGKQILNGKQLRDVLGISTTLMYQLLKAGMPYHKLTVGSRRYYNLNEVEQWLLNSGLHQETRWTK